jgi:hypothetical protein
MGSIDPFFNEKSSLYKNRVQLKIGFEIGSFKNFKKEEDRCKRRVLKNIPDFSVFFQAVFGFLSESFN